MFYKTLKDITLFKDLSPEHLHIVSNDCSMLTLRTYDPIVSRGETFFVVISGELEVYTEDGFGEKEIQQTCRIFF